MNKTDLVSILCFCFMACGGPEYDAKEICRCYNEVHKTAIEQADAKMEECLKMFDEYHKKYEHTDQYQSFVEAYRRCR